MVGYASTRSLEIGTLEHIIVIATSFDPFMYMSLSLSLSISLYIYIYVYICVCVSLSLSASYIPSATFLSS